MSSLLLGHGESCQESLYFPPDVTGELVLPDHTLRHKGTCMSITNRTFTRFRIVRIRIRGSMPLTNESGTCYFRHSPSRHQQKNGIFFEVFFCLLLFEGTFTSFLKIKSHKNSRNQGFSYYFFLMIDGSGSVTMTNRSGSRSRRPKHTLFRYG